MSSSEDQKCACVSDDAYECFRIRYSVPACFGVSFGPEEPEQCWCCCHDERDDDDNLEECIAKVAGNG
jgi:hypothetical protein